MGRSGSGGRGGGGRGGAIEATKADGGQRPHYPQQHSRDEEAGRGGGSGGGGGVIEATEADCGQRSQDPQQHGRDEEAGRGDGGSSGGGRVVKAIAQAVNVPGESGKWQDGFAVVPSRVRDLGTREVCWRALHAACDDVHSPSGVRHPPLLPISCWTVETESDELHIFVSQRHLLMAA